MKYQTIEPAPLDPAARPYTVRMRDGIHLATDVYAPDDVPGPVILVRLPYDKCGEYTFMPEIARYMNARGYRVVVQDVRGKFRSEGVPIMGTTEVYDGYDTLDWIIRQPWSDGVVGMWGDSYYGLTQWRAASSGHPALRAIAPRVTGTRLGELVDGDVEAVGRLVYMATHMVHQNTYEWAPPAGARPLITPFEEFFAALGRRSPSFDLLFPHEVPVRRYPDGHPFEQRPVAVLQTLGWYDNCAPWQWADVEELARRPDWSALHYLRIEAVDHENYHVNGYGDHAADPQVRAAMLPRYLDPALEFFDIFLRRQGSPEDLPRV